MKFRIILTIVLLISFRHFLPAKEPLLDHPEDLPPRVIRTCCVFGSKIGVAVVPFIKHNDVTGFERIGPHRYLGGNSEGNGIIYTRDGGFVDLGHLRDQADWTGYLYALMQQNKYQGCIRIELGHEGGERQLNISVPYDFSDEDILLLAGRISYDITAWHEIATWFGVSTYPFLPEQFSSFSVEDGYSNLLGVLLGMKAIQSDLPFDEAMTQVISEKLWEMGAVNSVQETVQALEVVRDVWWTREARLPSSRVTKVRYTVLYDTIFPMLLPDQNFHAGHPGKLVIPSVSISGDSLCDFYELSIKLNHKFPVKELFPQFTDRIITQKQFLVLINEINREIQAGFLTKSRAEIASNRKSDNPDQKKRRSQERNNRIKRT